ncbi:protein FAM114A2 [Anopheles cruzii]|uniref:protein FAM114A2 n=1 Tax=Anopheles cruzii TaxID=68878 RepID=UPI0022EC8FE8|nr:protein FAM114A2 [Anopheles cruzii]
MCDSDSEEFASADEDFEEIAPDELKAAVSETTASGELRSTKPRMPKASATSDVDQRKTDAKSDQHTSEKVVHSVHDEDQESDPPKPLPSSVKIDAPFTPLEAETSHKDLPAIPEPETVPEPTKEKSTEERKASTSSSGNEAPHGTIDETVTSKPRKLILKPARPQRLDEQTTKKEQPPSNVPKDVEQPEKPQATANEEGWDDFDDDWGDFSVDTGGSTAGGPKGKNEPQTEAKASFRDVDIDEVESKLQDFMVHRDDPPIASVLDRVATSGGGVAGGQTSDGQSWTGWKPSWGGAAVSFLSSASKSVASITTNITQVIESGIGVPNPEELARRQAEAEAKLRADGYVPESEQETIGTTARKAPSEDRFGFDQLVSGVTQISSKVITGGLDTLEGIGKKTMTILQENDPGLLNKRKLLGLQPTDGVVLSQVLREAKAKTEERERSLKQIQKHQYRKKLHFEALFDDYHGLVHLEALEMLSKQATLKLESLMEPLMGKALDELQETMGEVQELCELPEMDVETADADGTHTAAELEGKLRETIVDLDPSVKIDFGEIVKSWAEYTAWLEQGPEGAASSQDIFEKAMHALAQTTALCVLRMHKLAESLLISEHHSTATEADVLVQLTTVFCWHLSGVATRFGSELTRLNQEDSGSGDTDSTLVTNIFLEGSNSTSYIQNAFQLFIPILQLGAA